VTILTVPESTSTRGRDRILLQAAELFLANGYAETSLRTIADAVGMQPASIYHHFASKDALLTEILGIGMDVVNEAFDRAASDTQAGAAGRDRLVLHVRAHLHALFDHHSFTAAHVTVFPFVPDEVRRAAVPARDAYEGKWSRLLGEIAPHLDPPRTQLARLTAFGAMNATIEWFDPDRGDIHELGVGMGSLLWAGLAGGDS
jgi:AcrR family transcriptional regulator